MSGLQIKNIVKSFDGKNVLENISASIQEGEFVSFVGPSGCGKSTLLNMIANVEKPTSGNVTYKDKQVQEQDVVSYMPQQDLLLPWRSALQNIVLPLEIEGKPKKQRLTEGMEALKQFELDEYADHYPDELSGGMRQRISFLRTYLCESQLCCLMSLLES